MSAQSTIINPNDPRLLGQQRSPSIDEIIIQMDRGLSSSLAADMEGHPIINCYLQLYDTLAVLGMPKKLLEKVVPKIKVAVPAAFMAHEKHAEVITKFCQLIIKVGQILESRFPESDVAEKLLLSMVEDRLALVISSTEA